MKPGKGASLERLIESEDLGLELLHPGGLEITRELARLCGIDRGTSVLDVACGSGESACFLAETLGADVTGVDASERMVARARKKAEAGELDVRFQRADAHRLPFPDGVFDVAISECTLSLLEKDRALAEMVRVTRPGGRVGIHEICWKETAPAELRERLVELEGERPETLDGWRSLLERSGLEDVRAYDRSALMPRWMRDTRRRLGLRGRLRISWIVLRRWGPRGLRRVLESERIFASEQLGYGLVVGRVA